MYGLFDVMFGLPVVAWIILGSGCFGVAFYMLYGLVVGRVDKRKWYLLSDDGSFVSVDKSVFRKASAWYHDNPVKSEEKLWVESVI